MPRAPVTGRQSSVTRASDMPQESHVVGIFEGPWDTGHSARDGAVLGFEDIYRAFAETAATGGLKLLRTDIKLFTDYRRIRDFLTACDTVYANCGPWAALLFVVREREQLDVRIIREIRTVGWIGYIWQEAVAAKLERPTDQRLFPSEYARSIWSDAVPGVSATRIYYPMTRTIPRSPTLGGGGTVGFFSALSQDKGFDQLPLLISRMRKAGHHIDRLVLAGERRDALLFQRVSQELRELEVGVDFRGALSNEAVRRAMAACDCVFFLSVSSIESLGRIILEAHEQTVPVITADFGAARNLVHSAYRIPVQYFESLPRASDSAHPIATLALENWRPPKQLTVKTCYTAAVADYLIEAQSPADILLPPLPSRPVAKLPLRFSVQGSEGALTLAETLLDDPDSMTGLAAHDLLDLGGALKKFLLSQGYNPRVTFAAIEREEIATNPAEPVAVSRQAS